MQNDMAQGQPLDILDNASWSTLTGLFDELVELPEDKRAQRLASVPSALRPHLERMLAASTQSGLLDTVENGEDPADASDWLGTGERVGAFAIERPLGRGGMGEVYVARRADGQFDQAVAIKLLRIDAITGAGDFARERQLLARMNHPGIARLIDGGILPNGRPWMAMEFVEGQHLVAFIRETRASLGERLALFDQVAEAVAFAHANLVIHRDIKPGNVIVDKEGRARLLDFGIARLTSEIDVDAAATQALMTPYYAAPEQLSGEHVTTAADVHGLGLLLYEMMAGVGPWGESAGIGLMIRRVIDEEPAPPSRRTDPAAGGLPASELRGDIDAIVSKALRKEPGQRYASVADLRADIARHLEARPVLARSGNWKYRAGRYLRRNRWQVAASTALMLSLAAGAGLFAWQAARAERERNEALAEAQRSDAIVQVLNSVFAEGSSLDPTGQQTAKELLAGGTARLLERMGSDSRSGAAAVALADMFVSMQDPASAIGFVRAALARGIGRDDPLATGRLKLRLATMVLNLGGPEDPKKLLREATDALRPERGASEDDLLSLARTTATAARMAGDHPRALSILEANFDRADAVYRGRPSDLLGFYNNAAVYAIEGNRLDVTARVLRRADVVMQRAEARDTIEAIGIRQLRGVYALRSGRPKDAVRELQAVVASRRERFGESGGLASDLLTLSKAQLAAGDPAAALVSANEAQPLFARLLGPAAPPTMLATMARAEALAAVGQVAQARAQLDAIAPAMAGPLGKSLIGGQYTLARASVALRDRQRDEARNWLAKARGVFAALGPGGAAGRAQISRMEAELAELP